MEEEGKSRNGTKSERFFQRKRNEQWVWEETKADISLTEYKRVSWSKSSLVSRLHAGLRRPLAVPPALLPDSQSNSHIMPHPQSVPSWSLITITQPTVHCQAPNITVCLCMCVCLCVTDCQLSPNLFPLFFLPPPQPINRTAHMPFWKDSDGAQKVRSAWSIKVLWVLDEPADMAVTGQKVLVTLTSLYR